MLKPMIVNLYEREGDRFWPAGQYVFDSRKRAIACLNHQVCEGICGLVHDKSIVWAYAGMTREESVKRIVGVNLLGCE